MVYTCMLRSWVSLSYLLVLSGATVKSLVTVKHLCTVYRVSMFQCVYTFPFDRCFCPKSCWKYKYFIQPFFSVQSPAIVKALVLPPNFLLKMYNTLFVCNQLSQNEDTQDNSLIRTLSVVLRRKCPYWWAQWGFTWFVLPSVRLLPCFLPPHVK